MVNSGDNTPYSRNHPTRGVDSNHGAVQWVDKATVLLMGTHADCPDSSKGPDGEPKRPREEGAGACGT